MSQTARGWLEIVPILTDCGFVIDSTGWYNASQNKRILLDCETIRITQLELIKEKNSQNQDLRTQLNNEKEVRENAEKERDAAIEQKNQAVADKRKNTGIKVGIGVILGILVKNLIDNLAQ